MVSAILFDLDNTLIDRNACFRQFADSAFNLSPSKWEELVALDQGGHGDRELLLQRWQQFGGERLDVTSFGLSLARYLVPNPDLLHALKALTADFHCGIITNGGSRTQHAKWRAAGLDGVFARERLWISEEVGYQKPDARIFQLACQELQIPPSECLFVGDDLRCDIQGAQNAGLKAFHVTKPLTSACIGRLKKLVGDKVEVTR